VSAGPNPLPVAAAQPLCVARDVAANALAHAASVREAGARVVVFPEMSLTGYELDAATVSLDDPRLSPLVEACRGTGAIALAGAPVDGEDGAAQIAVLAFDGAGASVAYSKMCLGGGEPDRFTAGACPASIEVDGWRLGLGICKDTRIPEQTAATAALGIDAYLAGVCEHADDAAVIQERARRIARDHGVSVAMASFAGSTGEGYAPAAGGSGIWSADGESLARAGAEAGEIARAVLASPAAALRGRRASR
jgi:predicted amidohydrolase